MILTKSLFNQLFALLRFESGKQVDREAILNILLEKGNTIGGLGDLCDEMSDRQLNSALAVFQLERSERDARARTTIGAVGVEKADSKAEELSEWTVRLVKEERLKTAIQPVLDRTMPDS